MKHVRIEWNNVSLVVDVVIMKYLALSPVMASKPVLVTMSSIFGMRRGMEEAEEEDEEGETDKPKNFKMLSTKSDFGRMGSESLTTQMLSLGMYDLITSG